MNQRFESFVLSISQIYRCIQKIKSQEMNELGLRGPHVMCLLQLRQAPQGLTAAELSALCLEDKAAVSRTVGRLEELGLLTGEEPGDRRKYRSKLRLTPEGEAVTHRMTVIVDRAVEQGGRGLTQADREVLYPALARIAQNLTLICDQEETL